MVKPRQYWVILAVALVVLGPTLLNHYFLWQLERQIDVQVQKKPLWMAWPGRIDLNPSVLTWKDRLQVTSGTLEVRYSLSALVRRAFPVRLKGKNLNVQAGLKFRHLVGSGQVLFDHVNADLILAPPAVVDIRVLEAESKTVQFHLGPKR